MQCLILTPSASGKTGLLAEFIQGALDRYNWHVRIASGDHQGSGFADHTTIGKQWIPWFIKKFFLSDYLKKEKPHFSFSLCVVIGQVPHLDKLILRAKHMAHLVPLDDSFWEISLYAGKQRPKKKMRFSQCMDDDLSGLAMGQPSTLPALTKDILADFLLRPLPATPVPSYARTTSSGPKNIFLDLRIGGEANLCHWIDHGIGSVVAALHQGFSVERVALPVTPSEFQITTLNWLGIEKSQIDVFVSGSSAPRFIKLSPIENLSLYKYLRPLFLSKATKDFFHSRLYLSRSDANYRKICNEAFLEPLLEKLGCTRVVPSHLIFADQVALFRDASWILAPHGAALTLLFCCQPKANILELMPGLSERNCFRVIAKAFDLNHTRLACSWSGKQTKRIREGNLVIAKRELNYIKQFFI